MDYSDSIIPTVVLHWNYRGFTEFPLQLLRGEESEITDIYLKENLISCIPSDIGRLEHLESLYLSGNDITQLPREISKLRALKCLDVSGNRLRHIPDEIGDVRSLKFLILDENELSELPLRLAELRALRYLSVCDNNLQWLPQRPVYNYHHCEFRFWRNSLKAIPYSLWYHMFRNQQTRSFGIGKPQTILMNQQVCRLTIKNENGTQELDVPPHHQNVVANDHPSPPSLYELCKRAFYETLYDISKKYNSDTRSIYSDFSYSSGHRNVQDFKDFNKNHIKNIPSEDKNGNYELKLIPSVLKNENKTKDRSYYAISDLVEECYSFLPGFMKGDLCNGPLSRCENVACMKPVFDFVLYEFCLREILLMDRTEHVILSAVFCSKTCADAWKRGKGNTIPWTLVQTKSYATLNAEKYRQFSEYPLSIHPFSKLRTWVEIIVSVCIIVSNMLLPFWFSKTRPAHNDPIYRVIFIFDTIYLINIIVNIFTGYVDGKNHQYVVLDIRKIICKYALSWMIIDLVSLIYVIEDLVPYSNLTLNLTLINLKILRLPVLYTYMHNLRQALRMGVASKKAVAVILFLTSYLTWNIVFQYSTEYMHENSMGPEEPRKCSWITIGKLWNATSTVRFLYSLERAVGMLRDNANLNLMKYDGCFEIFFIVAWIIAKCVIFHCSFKLMLALFGSESARAKYYIMSQQVQTYMNQRRFPPRIKKKVLKFYAIRFQSHFFVESRMMACVSGQLREDIIMYTGRQLVEEVAFLKQLPRTLLMQITQRLRLVIFIEGDVIFKINTIGDCIYFILKGTVAIYSESGREVCHLEDGDYFGEIALVLKQKLRTASAVAVTHCELFSLSREDFESITCYPTVYEDIKKAATSRLERMYVLDNQYKAQAKAMSGERNQP